MRLLQVPCFTFLICAPVLSGCIQAPLVPPTGSVYSGFIVPLDLDFENTDLGSKTGKSESTSILGLVAWGDASSAAAARNGGISNLKHADYEYFHVLGVYQRYRTVVYGD